LTTSTVAASTFKKSDNMNVKKCLFLTFKMENGAFERQCVQKRRYTFDKLEEEISSVVIRVIADTLNNQMVLDAGGPCIEHVLHQ
jgi:hypothetical protein